MNHTFRYVGRACNVRGFVFCVCSLCGVCIVCCIVLCVFVACVVMCVC